jgi:hypothetical protein
VGRETPWGVHSKGFLDLGLLNESPGRILIAPYQPPREFPMLATRPGAPGPETVCRPAPCRGLIFVEASALIEQGAFGLGLQTPWVDYTLGWLDPIGAHADYRKPEFVDLMLQVAGRDLELAGDIRH